MVIALVSLFVVLALCYLVLLIYFWDPRGKVIPPFGQTKTRTN